ncbi:hypothetical protein [Providencia sp. JUb39]|uniref:hypothetical protein n=1 Tax=Providencia sp. JUb39 TaxID=2724165 RepID=UPI00164E2611|nr:hypothetical protein [Providencia sp. JUb39]MBC5788728.1 hypothetical protein [Providencia sp. JUb39]
MDTSQDDSLNEVVTYSSEEQSEHRSENISARSQRQRCEAFKSVGLSLKKAFLGQDALEKLAFIYNVQYGKTLNVNELSYDVLGDLLSFCINKCYNSKEMAIDRKRPVPTIKAAMTPAGQLLYRYYQMAMPLEDEEKDAMAIAEKFNAENKRGKQYFPHISQVDSNFKLAPLVEEDGYEDAFIDEQGNQEWLPREIQALWDRELINKQISTWNEQALLIRGTNPLKKNKKRKS